MLLGLGGPALLRALGHRNIETYHMNEGHSALLTLALLQEVCGSNDISNAGDEEFAQVRARSAFTTHTPVDAGHDRFPLHLVREVGRPELGPRSSACRSSTTTC